MWQKVCWNGMVHQTGRCPTEDDLLGHFVVDPSERLECIRLWTDGRQTVEMKLDIIQKALYLTVDYRPVSVGL
jgi:hypothetical protein